ncbi:MAG: ABC transporter permease subunit, partial [Polaromonas sp.]
MFQVLINGAVLGAVYALIALGLTMVFSIMRVVNFAHGQMYMLGAFV